MDLHTTIHLSALRRVVRSLGARFAVADGGDPRRWNTLIREIVADCVSPAFREALVVVRGSDVIGVPFDADTFVGITAKVRCQVTQRLLRLATERGGVEIEEDVVRELDGNLIRSRTGDLDSGDLLQLLLLLIHSMTDGRAHCS